MYVSHRHRAVFVAVSKTGSRSVGRALRSRFGFRGMGRHHGIRLRFLKRHSDYTVIAGIRNPYTRAVSLWDDTRRRIWGPPERATMHHRFRGQPFAVFAGFLGTDPDVRKFYPQARFLTGVRVDCFLRFEHLHEDFAALPFVDRAELPHLTRGRYGDDWRKHYTAEDVWEAVECWADEDFRKFGYEKDRGAS